MMKRIIKQFSAILLTLLLVFTLASCTIKYVDTIVDVYEERTPLSDRIVVNDYTVGVGESVNLSAWLSEGVVTALGGATPEISYEIEENSSAIRIENGAAYGIRSGVTVPVTASLTVGTETYECDFNIICSGKTYVAKEDDNSWFNAISTVVSSSGMTEGRDFALGTDISMVQQVLDMGGKYYDTDGKEVSVYQIMKDYGVNTVRIRLWVDPYYYEYDGEGNETLKSPYGGGICDTETVTKMAVEATKVGLEVMVCPHYSDYWSTGGQVMPKPWYKMVTDGTVTTVAEMAEVVKNYTKDTLQYMIDAGAKIKYWQLGNENLGGIMLKAPGVVTKGARGAGDAYNKGASFPSEYNWVRGSGENFKTYLKSMIAGIQEVYDDGNTETEDTVYTKTILHSLNVGGNSTFLDMISSGVDFDIMGVSAYIQYGHGMPSALKTSKFNSLGSTVALLEKGLMIVETSYAYTVNSAKYSSNTFQAGNANTYPISVQGQADNLRDTIDALAACPNGSGVITWEGAWLPIKGAGWSDIVTSSASWSNQAFFSYDGKVLPSLKVFNEVWTPAID